MGIFDSLPFLSSKPEDKQRKFEENLEDRNRDFVKQRDLFQAGVQDDPVEQQDRLTRNDLIRWQQELDDELFSLVQTLVGKELRDGEWIVTKGKPLCNKDFIQEVVIPQCKPFLSRNMINTKYDENRILTDLKATMDDIVDAMADGFDRYEIDFRTYDLVVRLIKNTINPSPYRAHHGWTKRMDNSTIKQIMTSQDNGTKRKGLFEGSRRKEED